MIITTTQNEAIEAEVFGLWLSLVSGALMIAVSVYENYRRGAKATTGSNFLLQCQSLVDYPTSWIFLSVRLLTL